jgi:hypothetical protein
MGQFGLSSQTLTPTILKQFIKNLTLYADNIQADAKKLLLRGNGQQDIIDFIEKHFLKTKGDRL